MPSTVQDTDEFLALVLANRWNTTLLQRLPSLCLNDWWLTAGCLAQSVWNIQGEREADLDILDYNVFYFDPDTSWSSEDAVIARAAVLLADLPIKVQLRNQARVPIWYEQKFGVPLPLVHVASDGIDRFPCATVAVGVRRDGERYLVHAPYAAKTTRWNAVWPQLVVRPWPDGPDRRSAS